MNPIYELIERNINSNSPYKNMDMIELMIETFAIGGKLTLDERQELLNLIHPPVIEEVIKEETI